jgi:hypothetical protein
MHEQRQHHSNRVPSDSKPIGVVEIGDKSSREMKATVSSYIQSPVAIRNRWDNQQSSSRALGAHGFGYRAEENAGSNVDVDSKRTA